MCWAGGTRLWNCEHVQAHSIPERSAVTGVSPQIDGRQSAHPVCEAVIFASTVCFHAACRSGCMPCNTSKNHSENATCRKNSCGHSITLLTHPMDAGYTLQRVSCYGALLDGEHTVQRSLHSSSQPVSCVLLHADCCISSCQ